MFVQEEQKREQKEKNQNGLTKFFDRMMMDVAVDLEEKANELNVDSCSGGRRKPESESEKKMNETDPQRERKREREKEGIRYLLFGVVHVSQMIIEGETCK